MNQCLTLLALLTFTFSALQAQGLSPSDANNAILTESQRNTFLARAGFDPSLTELANTASASQSQLAARLVNQAQNNTITPPAPSWVSEPAVTLQMRGQLSREARMDYRALQNRHTVELREWWVRSMVATPTPLRERMILFWHNHFPSSQQKVVDAHMLWQQHQVLRQHALGDFRVLLKSVVQSPAMIEYLDAAQNRAQAPNENLARELMELFTLGEGNYSEQDVKQAARALTGWAVNPRDNTFVFDTRRHDAAAKQVLGRSIGTGDDLLALLLAQPQTARWVVSKLWKEFISPTPDATRVNALAAQFQANGYNIAGLMAALLSEPALLAIEHQAALVKSPAELLVGTVRRFQITVPEERVLVQGLNVMGQSLFAHPSVKGWATGEGWITANTLLARKQVIAALYNPPREPARTMAGIETMRSAAPPTMVDLAPAAMPIRAMPNAATMRAPTPLAFMPERWLVALPLPVGRSLNPDEQRLLTAHVLHAPPAVPLDSSLEALPALKALMSDIAYQVK